jgi:hypothetical protein
MGIKEILERIKLADFQVKLKDFLKGGQVGFVNITVEKNVTINIQPDSEFWRNFASSSLTPEIEEQARKISEEKLEPIATELSILPSDLTVNFVTTTMATSAMDIITVIRDDKKKNRRIFFSAVNWL